MAGSEAISVGIASRALRLQVGGDSTGSHVVYAVVYMEKRTSFLGGSCRLPELQLLRAATVFLNVDRDCTICWSVQVTWGGSGTCFYLSNKAWGSGGDVKELNRVLRPGERA